MEGEEKDFGWRGFFKENFYFSLNFLTYDKFILMKIELLIDVANSHPCGMMKKKKNNSKPLKSVVDLEFSLV